MQINTQSPEFIQALLSTIPATNSIEQQPIHQDAVNQVTKEQEVLPPSTPQPPKPYIPRILIAAPQHELKRYCFEEWYMNVKSLNYDKSRYDILVVDNSPNEVFSKYMEAYDLNVGRINVKGKGVMQRMAESHDMCRKIALEEGYDFLLHLETDMFPEPDIIDKLLLCRKKVVSALYSINNGAQREYCVRFADYNDQMNSLIIYNYAFDIVLAGKGLMKCFNAGLGCTLIHRSVLNQFQFRYENENTENARYSDSHPDTWFAYDLFSADIPIYVDTNTFVEHRNANYHYNKNSLIN